MKAITNYLQFAIECGVSRGYLAHDSIAPFSLYTMVGLVSFPYWMLGFIRALRCPAVKAKHLFASLSAIGGR